MRRRVSNRELLARLDAIEDLLKQRTVCPLPGQEAISVATIGDHAYEGPGDCRAEFFGETCGEHRDAHHLIADEDQP